MTGKKNEDIKLQDELSKIRLLLEQLVAIQLYANGATQDELAKNLSISKTTANAYVKGMKIIKRQD